MPRPLSLEELMFRGKLSVVAALAGALLVAGCGTTLAQQAQLERAYAQYKSGDQAQALSTLDRFIKLHPASPALDYAYYLKGIVNFNDNLGLFSFISKQDLSERD